MGGLLQVLRSIGAAILRRPSPLRYHVSVPTGWTTVPSTGSRHYDEYRSPDDVSSVRVFTFESSIATLEDMISDDLAGIQAHEGAVIDSQSEWSLMDWTPAYRIAYSIQTGPDTRYGLDVMAVVDTGAVLMTLLSDQPVTPALLATFEELVDSLRTPERVEPSMTPVPALGPTSAVDDRAIRHPSTAIDRVPIDSCFDEHRDPTTGRLVAVVVSCDGPHQLEMIGMELLPDGPEVLYPGASAIGEEADKICRPLFERYVGFDYDRSEFTFWAYTPDRIDWPAGRRLVECAIGNADRTMQPPGSARDARR